MCLRDRNHFKQRQHQTKKQEKKGILQVGLRDRNHFKLLATLNEETGKGGGT